MTDLHEVKAQLDLPLANEILANNTLENNFEYLTEITGIKHDNLDILDTESFSPSLPSPSSANDWVRLAQQNNLSLLNQRLSVDIAKQRIDVAKSGHLPTLGASASLSHSYNQESTAVASNFDSANP